MADPRFFDNFGPFSLAAICSIVGADVPPGADAGAQVHDVASNANAGPHHVTYADSLKALKGLATSRAGYCLVALGTDVTLPPSMIALPVQNPADAFAALTRQFYPEWDDAPWPSGTAIDPTAKIGKGVVLSVGVVVGPDVEIGAGTVIGPNSVIGRGTMIGRNCRIGANCTITHSYIGDGVVILHGACIGQSGFGFSSSVLGHVKKVHIGRVLIQDNVEVGASCTIDRGALSDTIVGEGTKMDNLVQVAHNVRIGRHCIIVSQAGIAGSARLEDFVVMGGQAAVSDHAVVGEAARLAGRTAVTPGTVLKGRSDYGGVPARPLRDWAREIATLSMLARKSVRSKNDQ